MLLSNDHINNKYRIAIIKFLLMLVVIIISNDVRAQFCSATVSNMGTVTPTSTFQNAAANSGARRYWSFAATAGCTYDFSSCNSTGTNDTYLRLYSTATGGAVLVSNDDNGAFCISTKASLSWTCGTTGNYSILLTDYSCATLSQNSILSYRVTCAPPYNPCSTIATINCGVATTVTIGSGNGIYNPPATSCGYSTPGKEIIYSFTPTTTGNYSISQPTSFGYIDYFYKAASGGCNGTGWTCIDDITNSNIGNASINFSLTAGTTYYILLDPESTGGGSVTFTINCPTVTLPNDNCAGATSISLPYNSGIVNTTSATDDIPSATSGCGFQGSNVWYKLTGTGYYITATTCNPSTNYDTELRVYSGTCGSMTEVTCNDDDITCPNSGLHSSISWCSTVGLDYYISAGYYYTGPGFGNFVLSVSQSTACGPLPIELTDFKATCNNKNIELKWTTASETNNNFFTIEKSDDAENFSKVATINGAGNSNSFIHYSYSDTLINPGISYYRLKQTDWDGNFSYSNIISTNCQITDNEELSIYPNPSKGIFTIKGLPINSTLTIRDPLGKIYKAERTKNDTEEYNISDLPKGIYYIYVISNDEIKSKKIILQ